MIIATIDTRTAEATRPETIPEATWVDILDGIGIAVATGSRGAKITDPTSLVVYHAVQRYEDRDGVRTGTGVFDIAGEGNYPADFTALRTLIATRALDQGARQHVAEARRDWNRGCLTHAKVEGLRLHLLQMPEHTDAPF